MSFVKSLLVIALALSVSSSRGLRRKQSKNWSYICNEVHIYVTLLKTAQIKIKSYLI